MACARPSVGAAIFLYIDSVFLLFGDVSSAARPWLAASYPHRPQALRADRNRGPAVPRPRVLVRNGTDSKLKRPPAEKVPEIEGQKPRFGALKRDLRTSSRVFHLLLIVPYPFIIRSLPVHKPFGHLHYSNF